MDNGTKIFEVDHNLKPQVRICDRLSKHSGYQTCSIKSEKNYVKNVRVEILTLHTYYEEEICWQRKLGFSFTVMEEPKCKQTIKKCILTLLDNNKNGNAPPPQKNWV